MTQILKKKKVHGREEKFREVGMYTVERGTRKMMLGFEGSLEMKKILQNLKRC